MLSGALASPNSTETCHRDRFELQLHFASFENSFRCVLIFVRLRHVHLYIEAIASRRSLIPPANNRHRDYIWFPSGIRFLSALQDWSCTGNFTKNLHWKKRLRAVESWLGQLKCKLQLPKDRQSGSESSWYNLVIDPYSRIHPSGGVGDIFSSAITKCVNFN